MDTRTQLKISVGVALLGIAGLAAFGLRALDRSSSATEQLRRQIERVRVVARLEEVLHEIEDLEEGPEADALADELALRAAELGEVDWGSDQKITLSRRIVAEIERQRAAPRAERSWAKSEQLASQVEKLAIQGSLRQFDEDAQDQARRARDLAKLGLLTALVFSVFAGVTYTRLRRERVEAIDRLRHNDRLAALGTIAAAMAHELNNPLATIAGCTSAIGDRLRRSGADEDALEYIDMVQDEARRCTGLVNGLRDLARDRPLAVTLCDLGALAHDVASLIRIDRTQKPVELLIEAEERAELLCDPDKIKQLLLNLVVNARDASDEGDTIRVEVSRRGAAQVRLAVQDAGRGIAKRDLPRIFEAFHTDKTSGLGIGLFICKRIVDLHGGTITAHSDGPGTGARIEILLPTRLDDEGDDAPQVATRTPAQAAPG